ncbi:MAG: methyltransferase domain-containing protein [Balneolaceae bacterium]
MSSAAEEAVDIARSYYNSKDADTFYSTVWGGEDIHIGIYHTESDPIREASRRTQKRMAGKLDLLKPGAKVIDLGSGYGGAARFLARSTDCHIVALNLSEVENQKARELNAVEGLDSQIDVVDGNFEELPYEDQSFDIVWSQDAFLHSPDREQVLREASRVLKSGGEFVFTDPMQSDDCPEGVLDPILKRIHLESMASPAYYREKAELYGFRDVEFDEMTIHLKRHYSAVLSTMQSMEETLRENVSQEYLDGMKEGLTHWIEGAEKNYLAWGVFLFHKSH